MLRKIGLLIAALFIFTATLSAQTPNLGLTKPTVGSANWGTTLNTNFDLIDSLALYSNKNFGTVIASTPVINFTQTWNNSGVTFTGFKLNFSDTASATGSRLIDLQVGGLSKMFVTKIGDVTFAGKVIAESMESTGAGESSVGMDDNGNTPCVIAPAGMVSFCSWKNIPRVSVNNKPFMNLVDQLPARKQAIVLPNGGNTSSSVSAIGDGAVTVSVTNTSLVAGDSAPFLWNQITAATTNSIVSMTGNTAQWRTGTNLYWAEIDDISATTNVRFYAGLATVAVGTLATADTHSTGRVALFRYSTSASDTTFKAIVCDGSTWNVVNTGVTANTATHLFEIREDTANGTYYFYIDRVQVAAITSNLPSSGSNTNMSFVRSLTTLTTATATLGFGGMRVSSDLPW